MTSPIKSGTVGHSGGSMLSRMGSGFFGPKIIRSDTISTADKPDGVVSQFSTFVRGSDPRTQTCRSKLQNRRSKLNLEINKETMLRTGAEKLYRATANKRLRETVALELSFVNSNLQLLKEELADLNSSVQIYQNESSMECVPMIPLGLKETKESDFRDAFRDLILEHYSEDSNKYEEAVQDTFQLRQAIRTPTRDEAGVALLFQYFNLLYYIERRFFSLDRNLGVYFEWYDSLTGIPSCQRTVAFEKASILFNMAAVYTQVGTRQDRSSPTGIDAAVDSFLRAAGLFRYIADNFSNAPSMDLRPETLEMMVNLMLAQARECLFEKMVKFGSVEKKGIEVCLDVGQEAAQVSEVYGRVHQCLSSAPVKDYVPYSWCSLVLVKKEHYKALSHYYVAVGLLTHIGELSEAVKETLECIQQADDNRTTVIDILVPQDPQERKQLGRAHLHEALLLHEESMRVHRMCRQLRRVDTLQDRLQAHYDQALNRYALVEDEDDFNETLDPPSIQASTKCQLTLTLPDFSKHKIKDPFEDLGPLSAFCARHYWTAPRTIKLEKPSTEASFGFSIRGDAPVSVVAVDSDSIAQIGGMKEDDYVVAIGSADTKWCTHDKVVELIKEAGTTLAISLISPLDKGYGKKSCASPSSSSSSSYCSSSSGVSSSATSLGNGPSPTGSLISGKCSTISGSKSRLLPWQLFRRSSSATREKMSLQTPPSTLDRRCKTNNKKNTDATDKTTTRLDDIILM